MSSDAPAIAGLSIARQASKDGGHAELILTLPESGRRTPVISWIVVVLPALFGPRNPKISPCAR